MSELRRCLLASPTKFFCRWGRLRGLCFRVLRLMEGGDCFSGTIRSILEDYYGVSVGAYSYGECMVPGAFPPSVKIGRYVSVAAQVQVLQRNHPLDRLSLHPFFYNRQLGFVKADTIPSTTLEIAHDAWIGSRVIVTPGCRRIGIGAVIGAGAVVTKDVPDFAIVAGNPARLIRFRFDEEQRAAILASRWWERPICECIQYMDFMTESLAKRFSQHPLLHDASHTG